jgi:hypothetical protein
VRQRHGSEQQESNRGDNTIHTLFARQPPGIMQAMLIWTRRCQPAVPSRPVAASAFLRSTI